MQQLRAFVSCSDHHEDADVVGYITELVKSVGCEIDRAIEKTAIGHIEDKIKQQIRDADCLVAIMTARKEHKNGSKAPPSFVQQEIGMAFALDVPIIVFVERGVSVDGITPYVADYQEFERDKLHEQAPAVVGYLLRCKESLTSRSVARSLFSDHVREEVNSRVIINADGSAQQTSVIRVRSIVEQLASIEHELSMLSQFTIREPTFQFFAGTASNGAEVSHSVRSTSPMAILWYVTFSPPLPLDGTAEYSYALTARGTYPMTREELEAAGDPLGEMAHEEWIIVAPTNKLDFAVRFPKGYGVQSPGFTVITGVSKHEDQRQKEQLATGGAFGANDFAGEWELRLVVPRPYVGSQYRIYWTPPRAANWESGPREQAM